LAKLAETIRGMSREDRETLMGLIGERPGPSPGLRTLTLGDISRRYRVSVRSLLRYVHAGRLKAVRFGRQFQVTEEELRRFFSEPRAAGSE
jgi:excisionase family DNA binding protein